MNSDLGEFLKSQWAGASPNQYGSRHNPIVEPASAGQRLSNGQRVSSGGMGQAPPVGTTPEVPVTAATIGVAQPNCGPKMTAVIDPNTGRWTCQPAAQSGGIGQLVMYGVIGYLAWQWFQSQGKEKRHHRSTSEETNEYDY